jgi:hypothetical protein
MSGRAARLRGAQAIAPGLMWCAIWLGQKSWNRVAILARGAEPMETRGGLPGDPDDTHSRYLEAVIGGTIVGCLYLPNGNPAGPALSHFGSVWIQTILGLRALPSIALLTPLRYPMPYPANEAATAQAAIKTQVTPPPMVHGMCTVAPRPESPVGGSSDRNANSPNGPANDRDANPYRSLRSPSQLRSQRRIQLESPSGASGVA